MTILIVGDDPDFRTVATRLLEQGIVKRLFGVERETGVVVEVRDGEQAVRLTRQLRPDVVLLDVAIPRLDGLAATRRIKGESPRAKVVIVAVHDTKAYPGEAAESGADAFLGKNGLSISRREARPAPLGNSRFGKRVPRRGSVCL